LDKAIEAVGHHIGMNVKSSLSLRGIARFENHHAKLDYSGRSGRIVFLLKNQEFTMVTTFHRSNAGKKEVIWVIPSFEDPKFDPQKVIDTILSIIKKIRTIDIRYRTIDLEYKEALRLSRLEFDSLEGWE
jgi:hypothetical protein